MCWSNVFYNVWQVAIFEYLLQAKSLLALSRKVFIVDSGIEDSSTLNQVHATAASTSSQDSSAAATSAPSSTMGIGSGGLIKAVFATKREQARPITVAPLPSYENPTVVWQNDVEKAYDVLVEAVSEYLSDIPGIQKLSRTAELRQPLRIVW